ncbi:MAG: photosystem II protein Psb27 [Cyanobacteria bacterium RM1_2_2]|nr:photosystem II protein Psb27 [Cyanobacteria bacterium RM1_2_2]
MRRVLSSLFALILVAVVGLTGCSASPDTLSGDYRQDTLAVIESIRGALDLPDDSPDKVSAQSEARQGINDFSARYRRDGALLKLSSFTTMRTALNSLAGHYSSYPNRPVPKKLKDRLELEFKQVEAALKREA